MLLRYLTCRILIGISRSLFSCSSAAWLAPLLSIVTFLGTVLCRMAFSKKRLAAAASRLAVNRKSTVWPCLSTALYRYFQAPLTLIYVSSILQLVPTACLCFRKAFSSNGRNQIAQRLIDE